MHYFQNLLTVTSGRIDTADDPDPGSSVVNPVEPRFRGVLGGWLPLTRAGAAQLSSTTLPVLEGAFQYVRFKAGTSNSNARGQVVYWDDFANFVVTCDAPADARAIAGITLNAVTKGNYGFIQVTGTGQVKMRSSVTDTLIGNPVIVVDDDIVGDGIALGTTWTGGFQTRFLGRAAETLVNSAVNKVLLSGLYINNG